MRRLVLASVLLLAWPGTVRAQISPGPLSRAHQALEGALKCTQCHGPASDAMPRLCLSCHGEIGALQEQRRGLHARATIMAGKTCANCHPEHAGRDFDLVAWPGGGARDRFDHRQAGWPLEGKHAVAACEKCHRGEFRSDPVARRSPRKAGAGWTGLQQDCASCHASDDPHDKALGSACAECHDAGGWSPARRFNHDSTDYPLTGEHADVRCAACHATPEAGSRPRADGSRLPRFAPQPHQQCSACHADPHQGRLSARCSECHVTRGFGVLDRREFNHTLTRYPLQGRHRSVGCDGCHGRDMATPRPASATCAACHADRHAGEARRDGAPVDCSACHGVSGFSPATFTVAQHAATAFPLGGRHATVACAKCHAPQGTTIPLRPAATGCASCHADPHADQLRGRRCEECHGDGGWSESRYPLSAHSTTALPLEGRHAAIGCGSCHSARRTGLAPIRSTDLGSAGILFHLPETRCEGCHRNPHPKAAGGTTTSDCATCHRADRFRPATIDVAAHATFRFPLDGAHRAVACTDCHSAMAADTPPVGEGATLVAAIGTLREVPLASVRATTCAGCHVTPHGNQFARDAKGDACERCHDSDAFRPAAHFDHDRDAAFALKGAHADVPCARCHVSETIGGATRVRYRGTPARCEACHGDAKRGGPG